MNIFLDAYFWFRGIGCDHDTAKRFAKKETLLYDIHITYL